MKTTPLKYSNALLITWRLAELEATHRKQSNLEPVDFFLGLLKLSEIDLGQLLEERSALSCEEINTEVVFVDQLASCYSECSIDTKKVRRKLRSNLPHGDADSDDQEQHRRSRTTRTCFEHAEELARTHSHSHIQPLHLLIAILQAKCPMVSGAIEQAYVSVEQLVAAATKAISSVTEPTGDPQPAHPKSSDSPPSKKLVQKPAKSPLFDQIGRDLTQLAREGQLSPIIGRKSEIKALIQTLLRSRKNNAILIGEAGVGKTGIVEGLAQRIVSGSVPVEFSSKRIIEISMGSLMAGTGLRGDVEERVQRIIKEAQNDPDLVLFIDEIHLIMGSGQSSASSMDVANLLKPALARGEIRVIGATTTNEYRQSIEKDSALERRFQPITVEENTPSEAEAILLGLRSKMEKHHGVSISDEAITSAVTLSIRYLPDFKLPDKALDLVDQACAMSRFRTLSAEEFSKTDKITVGKDQIASVLAERCGIPKDSLIKSESDKLYDLEKSLSRRVKGQPEAITAVANAVRSARAGLKRADKPNGVFFFSGPSGTGKTELAKALAEVLYDDERRLLRFDMSEFMEEHSVSKLIGSPPGYKGHDEGGQLSNAIRRQPHSVVLFDEIEKAHPRILDLFLQIFDEGTLTDSQGRKCNFRESLIILTSNLGASTKQKKAFIGFHTPDHQEYNDSDSCNDDADSAIRQHLRPELVNRLTQIVHFRQLDTNAAKEIIEKLTHQLNERLKESGVSVKLDQTIVDHIIDEGYSPEKGARFLERTMDQMLSEKITEAVLKKESASSIKIMALYREGEICFQNIDALGQGA